MSKQDGYASRTAADLERKYNFGKTFAEVYGLIDDAQRAAEEAKEAIEGLTQEQIFNLLTNFGEWQGIYRDDNGDVYVNASYIKSGVLNGENLKVAAAIVEGELSAATITADKISGGELNFNKVKAVNLEVAGADVVGELTAAEINASKITGGILDFSIVTAKNLTIGQLPSSVAEVSDIPTKVSQLTNDSEYLNETGVTTIVEGVVTADYVNALGVYASTLESTGSNFYETVTIANGRIDFYSGSIVDNDYGHLLIRATHLYFATETTFRFVMPNGRYWELDGNGMYYYTAGGTEINHLQFAS